MEGMLNLWKETRLRRNQSHVMVTLKGIFKVDMFVHYITVFILIYLCMLYNIIVVYTSSRVFVLYSSCEWVITPLYHSYICFCINMFVNIISMLTEIYFCAS